MVTNKIQEQILKEYEEKSELIIKQMMQIIFRAQRKVDNEAYRHTLSKIESIQDHHKK